MRKKLSASSCAAGGANGDFLESGWKPIIKKDSSSLARSLISLRTHRTTASTSSLSSANSSRDINDCCDPSNGISSGNATYRMLLFGFNIESHCVHLSPVTCNLMTMRVGCSCCKICFKTSWQSESEYSDCISPFCESVESKSEQTDEEEEPPYKLPPDESTDLLRL